MKTEGRLFLVAPLFAGNFGWCERSCMVHGHGTGLGRGTGVVGGHIIPGHRTGLGQEAGLVGAGRTYFTWTQDGIGPRGGIGGSREDILYLDTGWDWAEGQELREGILGQDWARVNSCGRTYFSWIRDRI